MAKKSGPQILGEGEAFEMIELAIEDVEVLTRAFELIDDLCREANADGEDEEDDAQLVLH